MKNRFLSALLVSLTLLFFFGCAAKGKQSSSISADLNSLLPTIFTDSQEEFETAADQATGDTVPRPPIQTETPEPETLPEPETETELATEPETEPEPSTEAPPEPFYYHGLVALADIDGRFIIDQRYATENNFTGKIHYDRVLCLVQEDIVPMLVHAADLAEEKGCRIKIWDAYRPISVQQALHDAAPAELAPYVPAPSPYSMHARGITVDVTLCDMDGNELDMPTEFDDFSTRANSDSNDATEEQIANRELLNQIMSEAGFKRSKLEWWHFDGPNRDNYQILDISFAEYEAARAEAQP